MKKLIIILIVIVAGNAASAQTLLKVSLTDKEVINVSLDGRYFNKSGTSVTVGDLPSGRHMLQIYGMVQDENGNMRQQEIYEDKIRTLNGMITLFILDPATDEVNIQQQDINTYVSNNSLPPGEPGNADNDNDNNAGNSTDNNTDNNPVASPANTADLGTLTDTKSNDLKTKVAAMNTDTEKMKALKDGLQNEKITTEQVANMMDWLSFESTKLDFIEWAYNIVVDKNNYNTLSNKFTYKNYQDDFTKFMQDKQ